MKNQSVVVGGVTYNVGDKIRFVANVDVVAFGSVAVIVKCDPDDGIYPVGITDPDDTSEIFWLEVGCFELAGDGAEVQLHRREARSPTPFYAECAIPSVPDNQVHVSIMTVQPDHIDWAEKVRDACVAGGLRVDLDTSVAGMGVKILRSVREVKAPFMLVIGDSECSNKVVSPRFKGGVTLPFESVETFVARFHAG